MRVRAALLSALWMVIAAAPPAAAQRLMSRHGATLFELEHGGAGFGAITRSLALPPGCATDDYYVSLKTWVIGGGTFLAWERLGGVCVVETRSGRVRSLDTSVAARIVAVRSRGFGLAVARESLPGFGEEHRERLYLLNAFDAPWTVVDLRSMLPPPTLFTASVWSYDISAERGELLVVESRNFGATRTLPLMTRLSMATGAVLSVASITVDVLVGEAAVSRDGTRAILLCDDWYLRRNGVLTVDTRTGTVLAANAAILPHKLGDLARDSLIWDEAANRAVVVTHRAPDDADADSLHILDATTLAVVGVVDAPGIRVPVLPGNEARDVRYALTADPGTHTAFLVEHEFHFDRYPGGGDVARVALYAVDLVSGTVRQRTDLLARHGDVAGLLSETAFVVPAPSMPGAPVAHLTGGSVDVRWTAMPDVLHYVLDAGTAPGRADLSLSVGGTAVSVPSVPRGTYYVTIRAVGLGGPGPRSAPVRLVVP